jgi:hypothetical protein
VLAGGWLVGGWLVDFLVFFFSFFFFFFLEEWENVSVVWVYAKDGLEFDRLRLGPRVIKI